MFHHPGLQKLELKQIMAAAGKMTANSTDHANAKTIAGEAFKAVLFLECADSTRYFSLWQLLRNEALVGQDNYPRTMTKTYDILTKFRSPNWRNEPGGRGAGRGGGRGDEGNRPSGRSFLQSGDDGQVVAGSDGRSFPEIRCYRCQSNGHYSGNCPGSPTPTQHLQVGLCLAQNEQ